MINSKRYIEGIIYNQIGSVRHPTSQDDIYNQIQNLVYIYKRNPEWEDEFKEDIREYVKNCIDFMKKV